MLYSIVIPQPCLNELTMNTALNIRRPEEIRIENRTTHYVIILLWGLLDTTTVDRKFVSLKQAREWIYGHYGNATPKIPVIL